MPRLEKAKIKYISLCPIGANDMPVLFKDDDSFSLQLLAKASDDDNLEKGELLACVYAPDIVDRQGDLASADVIRKAMHDFLKEGEGIDIRHDGKVLSKDDAFVAESFEIQKDDPRFSDMKTYEGKSVDVTGGWGVVLKIENEDLRKLYREGKWNGVSMGGSGKYEVTKEGLGSDSQNAEAIKALAALLGLKNPYASTSVHLSGDIDMTKEELDAQLAKNNTAIETKITGGVRDLLKEAGLIKDPDDKKTPSDDEKSAIEKIDFSKVSSADLPKIMAQAKVDDARVSLSKSVGDQTKFAEAAEALKKAEEELAAATGNTEFSDGEDPEVARLTKELAVAQKRSNAGPSGGTVLHKQDDSDGFFSLSKEEEDAALLMAGVHPTQKSA